MESIAFIVNPIAGGRSKQQLPKHVAAAFPPAHYHTQIVYTEQAGDAERMAKTFAAQGFCKVVAVGGDGTVNEVARGLIDTPAALGIVPYGSGNGLARHLKIPVLMPRKALSFIANAQVRAIDYCTLNGAPFFCTAGVGFDALVGSKFAKDTQRGLVTYIKHVVDNIATYRPEKYRLVIDGKAIERTAFLITFANASQWGNNGYIAPHANISDGWMDVVIINEFAAYKLPSMVTKLFTRQLPSEPEVETFRCQHVIVECAKKGYAHYDGEPTVPGNRLEVKIFPQRLKVLTM
ncbi:hypothetical protein FACS1894156_4640 [Bacteroidia bacterium]|nr:hypothetical protein FACS1894156_4640 [Bacteroidia bacterium]